ncbi:outer membrane protein assembly factor BamB family protein [Henriciella litoralis]|uniref:outer membrane protein assembly factor BamB family protein n=1 Tax=Henriciella litoralis TaxID=568102 RepID=UPI00146A9F84|nr:PQQ-binding-like beta-propeller repeat protein [Henriciella litoralis]
MKLTPRRGPNAPADTISRFYTHSRLLMAGLVSATLLAACSQSADTEASDADTGSEIAAAPETSAPTDVAEHVVSGEQLYAQRCATCHDNPDATRAPAKESLEAMSQSQILFSMTSGKMQAQATGLSQPEMASLASYLSPAGDENYTVAEETRCKDTSISFDRVDVGRWGPDYENTRYFGPERTSLTKDKIASLEVAWSFGLPGTTDARVYPVITDDTVFVGAASGHAFALDKETGCIKWHNSLGVNLRSSLSLGEVGGQKAILFQDGNTIVHALDALNGEVIWTKKAAVMPQNMGTGSPIQTGDQIIVPLSAIDVAAAGDPNYECCKGHGAITSLDANTGERLWDAHMTENAEPTTISSAGTQLYGPAGAPIWTTPTIDTEKNRIYFGTGENTSAPATDTSDAIIALDLTTGERLWVYQATEQDMFNMACSGFGKDGPNCPTPKGPDLDFGGAVSLAQLADGTDVIVAGQKAGVVHVVNADTGELIWKTKISVGSALGGVHWGLGVANGMVFAPSSDPPFPRPGYSPKAGLYALDLETGDLAWSRAAERGCETDMAAMRSQENKWPDCSFFYGYSAAPAITDDVVFIGALDGKVMAFDTETGETVWTYNTVREFNDTTNGVSAHGGAIDNAGPAISGDMLFVQSGYAAFNQMPGNAFIAFRPSEGE